MPRVIGMSKKLIFPELFVAAWLIMVIIKDMTNTTINLKNRNILVAFMYCRNAVSFVTFTG